MLQKKVIHIGQIPDHSYRILIIGGSRFEQTNSLFNLINHEPNMHKIFLYAKDPRKAKYKFLIKEREDVGTKHFNDFKAFIEYSNEWMIFMKTLKNTTQIKNLKC